VTRLGRKPKGPALVDGLECSDTARERLRQILRATSGEATVAEVSAELGIGESRFHQLRDEVLQAAAECLEPRPAGRPVKPVGPSERRISELEVRNRELTRQLEAERLRTELALLKSAAAGPAGAKKTRFREALPAVSPSNPPATRRAPSRPTADTSKLQPSGTQPPRAQSPNTCHPPSAGAREANTARTPPY